MGLGGQTSSGWGSTLLFESEPSVVNIFMFIPFSHLVRPRLGRQVL